MREAEVAGQEGSELVFACFQVAGRIYALDVSHLREVLRWQPATPLPQAPALIEGVIDVRGGIVPVIDLGRVLAGTPLRSDPRARIAVAEVDGMVVGLAVEAAIGVISVAATSLEAPPALAMQAGYDTALAVLRRPDAEPILLLALDRLLQRIQGPEPAPPASGEVAA